MNATTIPIHSFSALVTNSSSETYVTCTKETVEATKELLSLFLKQSGSPHVVDDIFTVGLYTEEYDYNQSKKEWEDIQTPVDGPTGYRPAYISITLKDAWKDSPAEQEIIEKIIALVYSTEAQEFCS